MMRLPTPRGPLSEQLVDALAGSPERSRTGLPRWIPDAQDPLVDDDLQLALWTLYQQHYLGFDGCDPLWEWNPEALALRALLERSLATGLRLATGRRVAEVQERHPSESVEVKVRGLADQAEETGLTAFLQREATREQFVHFLKVRSLYHLMESDPHAFLLPRLRGAAKVHLAELQYDEFGAGRLSRLHSGMYAAALESLGLDSEPGAFVDDAPASTLATNNAITMFALHRRWRGASMGQLAIFEYTSPVPCRRVAQGARRLELPPAVAAYYDEHVIADSVHDELALHDICLPAVTAEPQLEDDVLWGAAAQCVLDELDARQLLWAWQETDPAEPTVDEVRFA